MKGRRHLTNTLAKSPKQGTSAHRIVRFCKRSRISESHITCCNSKENLRKSILCIWLQGNTQPDSSLFIHFQCYNKCLQEFPQILLKIIHIREWRLFFTLHQNVIIFKYLRQNIFVGALMNSSFNFMNLLGSPQYLWNNIEPLLIVNVNLLHSKRVFLEYTSSALNKSILREIKLVI